MVTCLKINNPKEVGGFGNQLFVIAAVIGTAAKYSQKAVLPHWDNQAFFEHPLPLIPFEENKDWNLYQEPHFHFTPIPNLGDTTLNGYFQSEDYFKIVSDQVYHHFKPKTELYHQLQLKHARLFSQNPVSLHIRRGDYTHLSSFHPVLPISYYKEATEYFPERLFLVFSDDIPWCKTAFKDLNAHIEFIENQTYFEDLFTMSMCQDHIIANSSFSWWGAWLNQSKHKKVIAPFPWFGRKLRNHNTQNLLPSSWLKLSWTKPSWWKKIAL